jgi:CDP-6-deoxy-D-xylo-4-hexulose-3-dehydrase
MDERQTRAELLALVRRYHAQAFGSAGKPFAPGDRIPYGGRVFDAEELVSLVDAALDFWLTAGPCAQQLERRLGEWLGSGHCALTNSGSSANLLAVSALCTPSLGPRRIQPGDEVITVAAGFPTTVTPIIQNQAVPVFVDVALPTYNVDVACLEAALSPRSKAVLLAHTLGNPFDVETVLAFCRRHALWLIEDNCDALGSRVHIDGQWRLTGTIGDIGTCSFYPAHQITTGEGGAVLTSSAQLQRIMVSLRDWGRDCWCAPGEENACRRRFCQQHGELPLGYDHRYVYSHFGYNLKMTDLQAAIGCAQIAKLPAFIAARRKNWGLLREGLNEFEPWLILPEPTPGSEPSWFGFALSVRDPSAFTRDELVRCLEEHRIQTRTLFAGNITKHPCFDEMRRSGSGYRTVGPLERTDFIMNHTFWIGVYPGITPAMIEHIIEVIRGFFAGRSLR